MLLLEITILQTTNFDMYTGLSKSKHSDQSAFVRKIRETLSSKFANIWSKPQAIIENSCECIL